MGKALPVEVTEMVISFCKEDDISRPMHGNCFTIEKNGEKIKVQKKLVLSNLKETYRQFKDRYPDTKIGFSKFVSLRPRECVLAGASGTHSVCVCTIHNNVKLMMAGSMMNKRTANEEIPLKHYSHAIAKTMCNPSLPSCHLGDCTECPGKEPLREIPERCFNEEEIEEIEFKQWTTTDRSTLETIVQSTDEFIESFLDKLETLRRHDSLPSSNSVI